MKQRAIAEYEAKKLRAAEEWNSFMKQNNIRLVPEKFPGKFELDFFHPPKDALSFHKQLEIVNIYNN